MSRKKKKEVVPVAADFCDEIRDKIRRLFDAAERMPQIEKYMPDTKWVRVPYEKSGYYAVGLIGSKPDYIAYGLPGKYSANAPEELAVDFVSGRSQRRQRLRGKLTARVKNSVRRRQNYLKILLK